MLLQFVDFYFEILLTILSSIVRAFDTDPIFRGFSRRDQNYLCRMTNKEMNAVYSY